MHVVVGIDPGIARTGYGVLDLDGSSYRALTYDCIYTPAGASPTERLRLLFHQLTDVFRTYQVQEVAVEQLFFNRNVSTALVVGQARGVALLAATEAGAEVFEYTPLQVKQATTGQGRASKQQVQFMVRAILGLAEVPKPDDVADALAVALCHCHNRRGASAI
ncbi:MAG: crossover junction endodeoxyribonuclease RuvC [Desulforudis sp.]|jgi:crossover junction endodeoxyribonuclease RuvC|nr:crossover junction endodeoxyribonuclease RuvC [Clostridia bacterium]RJX20915.1 MAG: crossover junction endodeoxyribonuclease RuvC [Desulforudis sp.]